MDETAQDKIIQFPNHEQDLRKKTHPDVEKVAGHSVSPSDLNPEDDSSLEKIREGLGDLVHISGKAAGTFGEKLGGENITYIEDRPSRDFRRSIMDRIRGKKEAA